MGTIVTLTANRSRNHPSSNHQTCSLATDRIGSRVLVGGDLRGARDHDAVVAGRLHAVGSVAAA